MNKVFQHQSKKSKGLLEFSKSELVVLALAGLCSFILSSEIFWLIGPGLFVGCFLLLKAHKRHDNHRFDHINLMFRHRNPPPYNLNVPDENYEIYLPRN